MGCHQIKLSTIIGPDGILRCGWCGTDPDYVCYHDTEWGRSVTDDTAIFEKLCLEGFQSGLSWLTILRKRESFRRSFKGFDPEKVARFGKREVNQLLADASIVRHRGKIEATINNARATLAVQNEIGSLSQLVWSFAPTRTKRAPKNLGDLQTSTPESIALSKELLRRGFKFIGPTTMHAAMQSLGLVNDHLIGCHVRQECT